MRCFMFLFFYLKIVGYKSRVAASTTFIAIAQDKSQIYKIICSKGISVSMHPIPLNPVENRTKTISKFKYMKKNSLKKY